MALPQMKTNDDLMSEWADYLTHNKGRAADTAYKYTSALKSFIAYMDGRHLSEARWEDMVFFTGLYQHQRGTAPRTRVRFVAAIRGFYYWANQNGYVAENLAANLPSPAIGDKLPAFLERRYAEKLIAEPGISTFTSLRDTAMMMTLFGSGARVGGLCAMDEEDLLFESSADGIERLSVRLIEKGRKERIVPVTLEVWAIIRAYMGHEEFRAIDRVYKRDGKARHVLWLNRANRTVTSGLHVGERRRMTKRSVQVMIETYGRRCGIPEEQLHPHAMRHAFGVNLAEDGVDIEIRAALMGHAKPETTAVYNRMAASRLRSVVEKGNPFKGVRTPVDALLSKIKQKAESGQGLP